MSQATDMINASTVGLDGAYSFAGIKPGTYYVHASIAVYIDPFDEFTPEDFERAVTPPCAPALWPEFLRSPSTAQNLHASIEARPSAAAFLFDDGTPAAGWLLSITKPKATETQSDAVTANMSQALALGKGSPVPITDDLGHYRIAGLSAGEYTLRPALHATGLGISGSNIGDGGSGISLTVYTGNTFSRADAKTFNLVAGEEHSGIDITVSTCSLHNIVGHVTSKTDGHALNSGNISLTSKENSTLHLKAAIRDDSFHYDIWPPASTPSRWTRPPTPDHRLGRQLHGPRHPQAGDHSQIRYRRYRCLALRCRYRLGTYYVAGDLLDTSGEEVRGRGHARNLIDGLLNGASNDKP